MTFNIQGWGRLSSGNIPVVTLQDGSRSGAPNIFTYTTSADLQAAIAAANYFSLVVAELNVGDLIYAIDSGNNPDQYMVSAVNVSAKTVTIVNGAVAAGDVIGTPPTTQNAIARYTNAGGLVIKNSFLTLSDANTMTVQGAGDVSIVGGTAANNGFAVLPNQNGDAGSIKYWNPAGTFWFGIKAGVNTGNALYTAPINFPSTSGMALVSTSAGVMSFNSFQQMTWQTQTGAFQMAVNNGYIATGGGVCTGTLPVNGVKGDMIIFVGRGGGGWSIAQNVGQTIHFNALTTTSGAGGSLSSTNLYNSVTLVCVQTVGAGATEFTVVSSSGTLVVV